MATVGYGHGRVGAGASHWHFTIIVNATRTQLLLAISCLGRRKQRAKYPGFFLLTSSVMSVTLVGQTHWKAASEGGRGQRSAEVIRLVAQSRALLGKFYVGEGTK